ncbi:unnamed protein product [Amoebophrya sp. A25]|nr:unnamed protein product [Amoebophrya sp. A25]|eukprot:GSA25T00023792001.1
MPHSFGKRARTRDKFSKAYRTKGRAGLSTYLTPLKRGDYVDIVADASEQKGMPFQFYHGRTGVIFNVTKSAVGVEVTKVVGNRQLRKRMHIRIEHVRRSRCNENFLKRVKENDAIKAAANKKGEKVSVARVPEGPKPAQMIKSKTTVTEVFAPREFVANHF